MCYVYMKCVVMYICSDNYKLIRLVMLHAECVAYFKIPPIAFGSGVLLPPDALKAFTHTHVCGCASCIPLQKKST